MSELFQTRPVNKNVQKEVYNLSLFVKDHEYYIDCFSNTKIRLSTFRAAIFEVPTTFPSLSFTSIPVNSSWFLIRTTLQMFAVAGGQQENFAFLSLFDNWLMFEKKRNATRFFPGEAFPLLTYHKHRKWSGYLGNHSAHR